MTLESAAAFTPCLVVLAVPAWSGWRLIRGLRAGDWNRPGWFGHAAWVFFLLTILVWLRGFFAGGLLIEDTCTIGHHQLFDERYYYAHVEQWRRIFPVSNKCNPGYDLIPAWVNPTVTVFFMLMVISLGGLGWATVRRRKEKVRRSGRSGPGDPLAGV